MADAPKVDPNTLPPDEYATERRRIVEPNYEVQAEQPVEAAPPELEGSPTDPNPPEPGDTAPVIDSLSPMSAVVGAADSTLTVTGEGFIDGSVVTIGGVDAATTFVSATEVTAPLASSTATAGIVPVTVKNGTAASGPIDFEFTAA